MRQACKRVSSLDLADTEVSNPVRYRAASYIPRSTGDAMATKKNVEPNVDQTQEALNGLRKSLELLGIYTTEEIEAKVKEVHAAMREPARKRLNDALIDAIGKLLDDTKHASDVALMHGGDLSIHVAYTATGERTITARAVTRKSSKRTGRKASGGKRPTLLVNGTAYANYAELCRALGVPCKGDSARRAYERANKEDAATYPAVTEVDSEVTPEAAPAA